MTTPKLTPDKAAEQARILSEGDGYAALLFARDNPGADVETLQDMILARGTTFDAFLFALNVSGANIQALQEVILTRGDKKDACDFALYIPGADVLACVRRAVFLDPQNERGLLRRLQESHPEVLTPEILAELSLGVIL